MSQFNFLQLTDEIRNLMLDEMLQDYRDDKLYYSSRFNENGILTYKSTLEEAIESGNECTLQTTLESGDNFKATEFRDGKEVKVPSNAAKLFSQSEFNRYYIRAICRKAIDGGIKNVEIYRARESSWMRPESEAKIGTKLNSEELLNDLRATIGAEPMILPDINSGLSVKIGE